jgi:hypothetical protein
VIIRQLITARSYTPTFILLLFQPINVALSINSYYYFFFNNDFFSFFYSFFIYNLLYIYIYIYLLIKGFLGHFLIGYDVAALL